MAAATVTYIIIACSLLAVTYLFGLALRGLRRPIKDISEVLQPIDLREAESFLDPDENDRLEAGFERRVVRRVQWNRMRIYLRVVGKMEHNARVLVNFANQEMKRLQEGRGPIPFEQVAVIEQLQREAIRVRAYCVLTIVKLCVILAIHPVYSRSLTWFRKAVYVDGIQSYKMLRNVSVLVFEEFGNPIDKLVRSF